MNFMWVLMFRFNKIGGFDLFPGGKDISFDGGKVLSDYSPAAAREDFTKQNEEGQHGISFATPDGSPVKDEGIFTTEGCIQEFLLFGEGLE